MNNKHPSEKKLDKSTSTSERSDLKRPFLNSPIVVGVGASAGGLEAFQEFLQALDQSVGMAVVLVQHLDPTSESLLASLLAGHTRFPVVQLKKNRMLKPDTVYVAPPRGHLELAGGKLKIVVDDNKLRTTNPIDLFFHSLAENQQQHAIGVILSGDGSDGTLGLKAISDNGGATFAQEPASAKRESMPRSAATTGVADHVLTPAEIARELIAYVGHLRKLDVEDSQRRLQDRIGEAIPSIAETLMKQTGHNFQHYKKSTISRRIQRRMQILKLRRVSDYLLHLQDHEEESKLLFRELLIGVTNFFRDPNAFNALAETALEKIFANRTVDDTVRIWVAGCANGAEAYTISILCRETMEKLNIKCDVQIFATDIDQRALQIARAGLYPIGIEEHVSPERLRRFFIKRGKKYQVTREIRDLVLFSAHNLISDPPFSRQDLISCRNLLIYLGSHLQNKLIPLFHYALRPSGYLFLGPSENISAHGELFRPINAHHRISQRKGTAIGSAPSIHVRQGQPPPPETTQRQPDTSVDLTAMRQRIVLDEFSPKSCVIDETGQVLNAAANLQKYLSVTDGDFHNNILKMAASGLRIGLRAAIAEAKETCRKVQHENVSVRVEEHVQPVMITVQPMQQMGDDKQLFLVVFHDVGLPLDREEARAEALLRGSGDADAMIAQLERELATTRDDLDSTLQDMEAANEELKSSNEELLSMNEELQSANEELETSKEEIRAGSDALARAHASLENLLRSTKIATVFLDTNGLVQWFTPSADEVYNLIATDIGRPLSHITHKLIEMPGLPSSEAIVAAGMLVAHEVQANDGRWFLRRVLPFLREGEPDGMIITFIDVTPQKRAAIRLSTQNRVSQILADADSAADIEAEILDSIRETINAEFCSLWLVDAKTNSLHCARFSVDRGNTQLRSFAKKSSRLRFKHGHGLPGRVWKSRQPEWIADLAVDPDFKRKNALKLGLCSGMAMPIIMGNSFYGVIELFTNAKMAEDPLTLNMLRAVGTDIGKFIVKRDLDLRLRDEESRKTAIMEAALDAIITMDVAGRIVDFNPAAERIFGLPRENVVGQPLSETIVPESHRAAHEAGLKRYLKSGQSSIIGQRIELTALRADGTEFPVELAINAATHRNGQPFFTAHLRDIAERKHWESQLANSEAHLRRVIDNTLGFVGVLAADGTLLEANQMALVAGGVDRDEVIGKKFWDCYWWNFDTASSEKLKSAIEQAAAGATIRYDVMVRMAGDRRITIDFMLVPIGNATGQVEYLIPSGIDISDRKAAELDLQDRRDRYETLVDATAQIVWTTDAAGQVVEDSPSWRAFTGQSMDQWTGTGWLNAIHPEDQQRAVLAWKEANRTISPFAIEYRLQHVDGGFRWTQVRAKPQLDADGQVIRWIGMNTDISERKNHELTLAFVAELYVDLAGLMTDREITQLAGEKIADFLDLSHCLFIAIDNEAETANVYFDSCFEPRANLCGTYNMSDFVVEPELQNLRMRELIVIDDTGEPWRPAEKASAFAALNIGAVVGAPCLHGGHLTFILAATKPNRYQWQENEIELLRELATQLYLRIERARVERALQRNEKRLAMALRAGGMAAWEWTPEKSFWTPELYELVGIPASRDANPEVFFEYVHPEDVEGLKSAWQSAVDGANSYAHEFRIVRPNGEIRWLVGVGETVRDKSGRTIGLFGLNWDSTREHEAALTLRDSERRAQEANQAKSEFLANMSHEIRTPMTAVLGYAEILLNGEVDFGKIEHLRTIIRNGNFLLEVINDILDLSKIEAGKLDIDTDKIKAHAIVRDIVSLMQVRADEKGLGFEVEFEGHIPSLIETDARRLKQILVNLIGNAIKFTDSGNVKLLIRLLTDDRPQLQFNVIDTGIGISDEQMQRLFQPFAQGDSSVSREFGGSGLGLAISRRLAAILGGDIYVKSQPGNGSTFSCTIDVGDISDAEMIQPTMETITQSENRDERLPQLACRVLVVDDRRDVRMLTRTILGKAGATVEQASDGQAALDRVQRSISGDLPPIDLVLLDMQMPRLDGYQTALALRTRGFENPIIALTADAMQGDMNRCLESGCNWYLSKPIDSAELIKTVDRHVDNSKNELD